MPTTATLLSAASVSEVIFPKNHVLAASGTFALPKASAFSHTNEAYNLQEVVLVSGNVNQP